MSAQLRLDASEAPKPPEVEVTPRPRRDGQVWETNFCFTHGCRTPWDKTCEGFRIYQSENCDVAPAVVTRREVAA